jgi:serine/threonine protein phosphatase 1
MSKIKTIFTVSDIHGHYTQLKEALDRAGFDDTREDHMLVCCGDLFDRGRENRKVYEYMRILKHKVLIRGNHDQRLWEILRTGRMDIYDLHNGVATTIEEFLGEGTVGEMGEFRVYDSEPFASEMCDFIDTMVDYLETEHYVFVHGWLPTVAMEKPLRLLPNWRQASFSDWNRARFTEWTGLHGVNDMLPEKTIVCGHRPTRLAYAFDPERTLSDPSIYYGEKMIAIDAGTIRTGVINVLVLENEAIEA